MILFIHFYPGYIAYHYGRVAVLVFDDGAIYTSHANGSGDMENYYYWMNN